MAKVNYAKILQAKSGEVLDRSFDRFDNALDEARARKYSVDGVLSDSIAGWIDMVNLACLPWKLVTERERLVEFEITTKTSEAMQAIPIPRIFHAPATASKLENKPQKKEIPESRVHAELSIDGDFLVVTLDSLTSNPRTVPGLYIGTVVDVDGDLVANVAVRVRQVK